MLSAIENSHAENNGGSEVYYWILFYFGTVHLSSFIINQIINIAVTYISTILGLLAYHYYALKTPQYYLPFIVKTLRFLLLV